MRDILIELCQVASVSLDQRGIGSAPSAAPITKPLPSNGVVTVVLFDGSTIILPPLLASWVQKQSIKSGRANREQLEFTQFAFEIGVLCSADKLSPEAAAYLMRIIGTAEADAKYGKHKYVQDAKIRTGGWPLFKFHERFDKWTLKTYLNNQYYELTKASLAKLDRRGAPVHLRTANDLNANELRLELARLGLSSDGKVKELRERMPAPPRQAPTGGHNELEEAEQSDEEQEENDEEQVEDDEEQEEQEEQEEEVDDDDESGN